MWPHGISRGGRNIGSGRSPLLPGNKWEGLFLAACQDTEMQTGVLLRIRRGYLSVSLAFRQWMCLHVQRNAGNCQKSAHYKNPRRFWNHKVFLWFCRQNVQKTCTHWINHQHAGKGLYIHDKIGVMDNDICVLKFLACSLYVRKPGFCFWHSKYNFLLCFCIYDLDVSVLKPLSVS